MSRVLKTPTGTVDLTDADPQLVDIITTLASRLESEQKARRRAGGRARRLAHKLNDAQTALENSPEIRPEDTPLDLLGPLLLADLHDRLVTEADRTTSAPAAAALRLAAREAARTKRRLINRDGIDRQKTVESSTKDHEPDHVVVDRAVRWALARPAWDRGSARWQEWMKRRPPLTRAERLEVASRIAGELTTPMICAALNLRRTDLEHFGVTA